MPDGISMGDTDVVRVRGDEQVQTVNKQWDPAKTIDGVSLFAQCLGLSKNARPRVTNNGTKSCRSERSKFKE